MKGFGIYIKNDLLEPKHIENMGTAVWLYMWFIDKMTSISEEGIGKVLGGKPIKYEEIEAALGVSRRTYARWIEILEKAKYINVIHVPYGLIITVNKAKKVFNQRSAKNGTPANKRDMPKMAHQLDKNGTSGYAKNGTPNIDNSNIDKTVDKTTLSKDNGKPMYGNDDINQVSEYFLRRMGIPKEDCTQKQSRQYWYLLLKESKKGIVGVLWLIDRAKEDSWYAKNITSSKDLYYKRIKILQRKASHVEKFAVMKGGENNGQEKLEIEDSRGNSLPDNAREGILPTGNQ